MRLDKVYIDGFKSLLDVSVDFDESRLTTVLIGQNGAGKSNLLEAIADIFRFIDLQTNPPHYTFEIEYRIRGHTITVNNRERKLSIYVDGTKISVAEFDREKTSYFPDLVFGYYSGTGRQLESRFDEHQEIFSEVVRGTVNAMAHHNAILSRRLFYCRQIQGAFALLAMMVEPNKEISKLLKEHLKITGFHSALAQFSEPSWLPAPMKSLKARVKNAPTFWNAAGLVGEYGIKLKSCSYLPITFTESVKDDYQKDIRKQVGIACFIRDIQSLRNFSDEIGESLARTKDQSLFHALEAIDVADLIRELNVWVTRENDDSGDQQFSDLSDGERQLLMVLGLIRMSRGKETLFLLDEPDTHLNPKWQLDYLSLIRDWAGTAADPEKCQILINSHNPLTIAGLEKEEVRVMHRDEGGKVRVMQPYADPKGMGFTSTVTEVFGLSSSLDIETQKIIDNRNKLARLEKRSAKQERDLIAINDKLNRLGFLFEDREPLYDQFLKATHDVKFADRPPLSPDKVEARRVAMKALIAKLMENPEGNS